MYCYVVEVCMQDVCYLDILTIKCVSNKYQNNRTVRLQHLAVTNTLLARAVVTIFNLNLNLNLNLLRVCLGRILNKGVFSLE